jgi:hypothetical protein
VEGMNAILCVPPHCVMRPCSSLVGGWSPLFGEGSHLSQHQLDGGGLGVGWVAVPGEQALDRRAQFGAHVIPGTPSRWSHPGVVI